MGGFALRLILRNFFLFNKRHFTFLVRRCRKIRFNTSTTGITTYANIRNWRKHRFPAMENPTDFCPQQIENMHRSAKNGHHQRSSSRLVIIVHHHARIRPASSGFYFFLGTTTTDDATGNGSCPECQGAENCSNNRR